MTDVIASRTLSAYGGFDLRAVLVPDQESTPGDADCYNDADIAAWRAGQWGYVPLRIVASRDGIDLGDALIGTMEYGQLAAVSCDPLADAPGFATVPVGADDRPDSTRAHTDTAFGHGYGSSLIEEAVAEATRQLHRLRTPPRALQRTT